MFNRTGVESVVQEPAPKIRFGSYVLLPREYRLFLLTSSHACAIHLSPKAFDLLVLLALHPGQLFSKQELFLRLWERTFVDDSTLHQYVFTIRKTLGEPKWIETVPKRGYRFASAWAPTVAVGKPSHEPIGPGEGHRSPQRPEEVVQHPLANLPALF